MPTGYASGMQTPFYYVTISQVRDEGITVLDITDAKLLPLIKASSHWINLLTDQWFLPLRLRERTDGGRGSVARMPNQIPILELFALKLEKEGLFSFDLPSVSFQVKQRYVSMLTRGFRLPEIPHFVVLDGVFGWLVDETRLFRTTLTAPVALGATVISVSSVAGIKKGDAVLVGSAPEPRAGDVTEASGAMLRSGPIVVSDIAGTTLLVDPVEFEIPVAGVSVVKYGRVPDLIQRATMLLIRDRTLMTPIGEKDPDADSFGIGGRLRSESVEGYSYSLAAPPAVSGFPGGGGVRSTGNVEVDTILDQFATPSMYLGTV